MRVGIAIPSYQGRRYIGETLRSLIAQTHGDWYCVVVNDGEEDGTRDVVRSLSEPRIRYVADGLRRGQLRNFNRAILEVLKDDPQVVRLLSADDLLYPHDLADMLRVFGAHPRVGLVATHYDGIDEDGRPVFRVNITGRDDLVMTGRDYLLKGYAPFWIPRIPYQLGRAVLGLPVSRRLLWRRVHEGLQPPRIPDDRTNVVPSDATAHAPELQESRQ